MSGLSELSEQAVETFIRYWETAFNNRDYRDMAAHYTHDAVLVGTHLATLHGRPAIERFWRQASHGAHQVGLTRTVHADEVDHDGALGFVRGTVVITPAGETSATVVRYLTLWRRRADGLWRIAMDISSAGPHAQPPSPDVEMVG